MSRPAHPKSDSNFERHPVMTIAAIIIAAILIGGSLFAVVDYQRQKTALINEGIMNAAFIYRVDSEIYHHDFEKYQSIDTATWGNISYKLRTNSLGFKDGSTREVPLKTSKYRIVFMGDSFTEGIGMAYEQTFAGLAAKKLAPENVEVLNAAVLSYSPIIYWRKAKHLLETVGLEFDEMVVFIDISDAWDEAASYYLDKDNNVKNIIDNHPGLREKIINKIRKDDAVNSLEKFMAVLAQLWPEKTGQTGTWTIDEKQFSKFGQKGLENMTRHMDLLRMLLAEHDIKLTVAVYPWPVQIAAADINSIQADWWGKWCARHNIDFINYFHVFCKQDQEENKKTISKYFINGDTHWNYAGHQLVAQIFCDNFHKTRTSAKSPKLKQELY